MVLGCISAAFVAGSAFAQGPGTPAAAGSTAGPKTEVSAGVVSVTVDSRVDSTGYGNLPDASGGLITSASSSTIPLPSISSTQNGSGLIVHASRIVGSDDIRVKFTGSGGKVAGQDVGDASLVLTAGTHDATIPFVLRYTVGTSSDVAGRRPFTMTVGAGTEGSAGHLFGFVGGGNYRDRIHGMRATAENGLGVEGQLNLGQIFQIGGFMQGNPLTTHTQTFGDIEGGRLSQRALSGTIRLKRTGTQVSVKVEYASQDRSMSGEQIADPRFDFIADYPPTYYGEKIPPFHYNGQRVEAHTNKMRTVGASVNIAW